MSIELEERKTDLEPKRKFEVIQGGKALGSGDPPGGANWLAEMDVGTIFLVKNKLDPLDYILHPFEIGYKAEVSIKLITDAAPNGYIWSDPITFCRKWMLHEILGIRTNG